MQNPFQVTATANHRTGEVLLKLSLTPEALMLRPRFRGLLAHYQVVPEPIWFDLGKDMDLVHEVPCVGAPPRLCITCYGVRHDGLIELVFRNWGDPARDGLPL